MMGETARVSVVIAAYNAEDSLAACLDSVFSQTLPPEEIIVVDDGSEDGTPQVAQALRDRVRYVRKENGGPSAARNRGILEARGEWIAFLDADDAWLPERLELQLALAKATEAEVVFSDAGVVSPGKGAGGSWLTRGGLKSGLEAAARGGLLPNPTELLLRLGSFVLTSTVLARGQALLDVGLFDENFRCAEDFELFFRLSLKYRFAFHPTALAIRSVHGANVSQNRRRMITDAIRVREKIEKLYIKAEQTEWRDLVRKKKARLYLELASLSLQSNELARARQCWAKSFSNCLSPVVGTYWALSFLPPPVLKSLQSWKRAREEQG